MVAVTVILAAVIGSFVTGLSDNLEANPQAGVTFDQTAIDGDATDGNANGEVRVQVVNLDDADNVSVQGSGVINDGSGATQVGDSELVTVDADEQITVTATLEGKTNVIQTYTAD
jgi:FlaG/FlaF family flagellin (archaellin)